VTEAVLADYRAIARRRVEALQRRYRRRAAWQRRIFRASGVGVIVIGAGLPLLASFEYPRKDLVVATAGVLIAIATGLRSFYNWDQMWAVLHRAGFELTVALDTWELDFRRAEGAADPAERERAAYEATHALFNRVAAICGEESTEYFGSLAFPPQPG
jgi:hypothetical protein